MRRQRVGKVSLSNAAALNLYGYWQLSCQRQRINFRMGFDACCCHSLGVMPCCRVLQGVAAFCNLCAYSSYAATKVCSLGGQQG